MELLQQWNINHCSRSGDTRFDRVITIREHFRPIAIVEAFAAGASLVVAGSTWPRDEEIIAGVGTKDHKWIIAPHEISEAHLQSIEKLFPHALRYSMITDERDQRLPEARVLIIDNVGMLSRLYHYATIAYVGGGFTRDGIHNILEAAVWNKPVIFGPNYAKYREARELIAAGGAFSIEGSKALQDQLAALQEEVLEKSSANAGRYVQEHGGATAKVMAYIQEKRLLTSP